MQARGEGDRKEPVGKRINSFLYHTLGQTRVIENPLPDGCISSCSGDL